MRVMELTSTDAVDFLVAVVPFPLASLRLWARIGEPKWREKKKKTPEQQQQQQQHPKQM